MLADGAGSNQTFCIQMIPSVFTTDADNLFLREIKTEKGVPPFSDGGPARNPINIFGVCGAEVTAISTERNWFLTHHPTDIFVSSF